MNPFAKQMEGIAEMLADAEWSQRREGAASSSTMFIRVLCASCARLAAHARVVCAQEGGKPGRQFLEAALASPQRGLVHYPL